MAGDVGKAGVAIDSVLDMKILFDQIPLDQMSVSMTMNGAVLPIMAFYIVAAEEQGVAPEKLSGTIQNDILKEFMVRNTYIYPPAPSMRIIGDIFRYCSEKMPKFNCISICGYHMQEAGRDRRPRAGLHAGRRPRVRAHRASRPASTSTASRRGSPSSGASGMNYFMEIAKMRAARVLWAKLVKPFDPKNPKSMALRTHSQTSGWSLAEQDPFNNVARTCVEALAAALGHTQSLHTNALDEAIALPTRLLGAHRAQHADLPAGGDRHLARSSIRGAARYYVESLTARADARAPGRTSRRSKRSAAWPRRSRRGLPKMRIEEAAARRQARIDSGRETIVGVNKYRPRGRAAIDVLEVDNAEVRAPAAARGSTS